MKNKNQLAFILAGIGLECCSMQTNNWQSILPLITGMVLVIFALWTPDERKP